MKRYRVTSINELLIHLNSLGHSVDHLQSLLSIYQQADSHIRYLLRSDKIPFSFAFLFNGRFSVPHAYLIACRNYSLPVFTHEYDALRSGITLALNSSFGNVHQLYSALDFYTAPVNWQHEMYTYQVSRLANLSKVKSVPYALGDLANTIVYFTSSSDEYAADDPSASYEAQLLYIKNLSFYAADRGYRLIVRCHPNNGQLLHPLPADSFLSRLSRESHKFDFTIIEPTSNISSYALMSHALCSFVSDSHIVLEGLSAGLHIYSLNQSAAICQKIPKVYLSLCDLDNRLSSCISQDLILNAQLLFYKITVGRSLPLSRITHVNPIDFVDFLLSKTSDHSGYLMAYELFRTQLETPHPADSILLSKRLLMLFRSHQATP